LLPLHVAGKRAKPMTLPALIFDLDDTLMEQHPADRAAYRAVTDFAQRCCGVSAEALDAGVQRHGEMLYRNGPMFGYCHALGVGRTECLWGQFTDDIPEIRRLAAWLPEFRRETWRRALTDLGITDEPLVEELVGRFIEERTRRQIVFPDVGPALPELYKHHKLAMLTNGAPSLQRFKIDASGLARYFATITISGELGIGKPDPRIFHYTLEQLGVAPEKALMIGDSIDRDVRGAQKAGLRCIWLNRFAQSIPQDMPVDGIIHNLSELISILEKI